MSRPELLGQPLATPRQRALAMGIDVAVLALVSQLANNWLMMAAALGLYTWLRQFRPEVFARLRWRRRQRGEAGAELAALPPPVLRPQRRWLAWLLVAWFGYQGVVTLFHGDPEADAESAAETASQASGTLSKAELRELRERAEDEPEGSVDAADAAASAAVRAAALEVHHQALHGLVRAQEKQLDQLREEVVLAGQPQAMRWLKAAQRWMDELLRHYVTPALYFCLLPSALAGSDPGQAPVGPACAGAQRQAHDLDAGIQAFWRLCRGHRHRRHRSAANPLGPEPAGAAGQDGAHGGVGPACAEAPAAGV